MHVQTGLFDVCMCGKGGFLPSVSQLFKYSSGAVKTGVIMKRYARKDNKWLTLI